MLKTGGLFIQMNKIEVSICNVNIHNFLLNAYFIMVSTYILSFARCVGRR